MPRIIKIIKKRILLSTVLPPMIMSIIEDFVKDFARAKNISKYRVDYGHIEENESIVIDDGIINNLPPSVLMTFAGSTIETIVLNHYKVSREIAYQETNKHDIVKFRHAIHFFMAYYSDMSFTAIGHVTGGMDHATVSHGIKRYVQLIDRSEIFKKDAWLLDLKLFNSLNLPKSKVFDKNADLMRYKRGKIYPKDNLKNYPAP